MKKLSNIYQKIIIALILLMPLALFLSYHPVISFGSDAAMNFEINIAEIWLVLFFLASLPFVKKITKFYGFKKLALAAIIPTYFTLSIIWSTNRIRTLLTAGLFWLIVFAALSLIYWLRTNSCDKKTCLTKKLAASLLITSIGVSIFCWLQCILDLAGVSKEYTLLCQGCVSTKFGFPHPNGFAIEPQFMGNLLIVPVLLCFYLLISPKIQKNLKKFSQKIALIITTIFLNTTLFLTFSRGAIYAFALALVLEIVLVFIQYRKEYNLGSDKSKNKNTTTSSKVAVKSSKATANLCSGKTYQIGIILKPILISVIAFAACLTTQGIFASVSSTSDTFFSGITKSIHQLSLGKIDFRPSESKDSSSTYDANSLNKSKVDSSTDNTTGDKAVSLADSANENRADSPVDNSASQFSGYVAESTDTRLSLNQIAIKTWSSNTKYLFVGTGLGGAGVAMNQAYPEEIGPKEIVQNEYVSLLLETGLIGYLLILAVIVIVLKLAYQSKKESCSTKTPGCNCLFPLFASVVLAFAVTLLFFSGLPNAIHVYLFPLIFLGVSNACPA